MNLGMQTVSQHGFARLYGQPLPIYAAAYGDRVLFYAPGLLCALGRRKTNAVLAEIERLGTRPYPDENPAGDPLRPARQAALRLVKTARRAVHWTDAATDQALTFECLTLYVNNQCNLKCRYCYSQPDAKTGVVLSVPVVRDAARMVAGMCAERNSPFTLAFHGGGEPTLNPSQVDRLLGIVLKEAGRFGLSPRTYIATNGAHSEKTANWLASRFDLVGVSCDGPPDIQGRNRPGRNGQHLSGHVERTLSVLHRQGRPFQVRVTITGDTVDRQTEIVAYLADRFSPAEIRIEPVYVNPCGEAPLAPSQAAAFTSGFLAAQKAGAVRGVPVTTSITRPGDVYGPYCNVLRRVLNLVPGDIATGCFLYSRPADIAERGLETGSPDASHGSLRIHAERIRSLTARCAERPAGCKDCLCSCQCTYGCPDRCVLEASGSLSPPVGEQGGFRCRVNRMLMASMLYEAADAAWADAKDRAGSCGEIRRDTARMLDVAVYRDGRKKKVQP